MQCCRAACSDPACTSCQAHASAPDQRWKRQHQGAHKHLNFDAESRSQAHSAQLAVSHQRHASAVSMLVMNHRLAGEGVRRGVKDYNNPPCSLLVGTSAPTIEQLASSRGCSSGLAGFSHTAVRHTTCPRELTAHQLPYAWCKGRVQGPLSLNEHQLAFVTQSLQGQGSRRCAPRHDVD
jgi:hypothetical protein